MKIVHYSAGNYPSSSTGGPLKIIYLLIRNEDNKGIKQYVLTNHGIISEDEFIKKQNYENKVKRIKKYWFIKGSRLARFSSIKRDMFIYRHLIRFGEFIFHNHFAGSSTLLTRYLNNKRIPMITTFQSKGSIINEVESSHGVDKNHLFSKYLFSQERFVIKNSNIVTFPSRASFNLMKASHQEINFDKIDVRIVYNGIDDNLLDKIIFQESKAPNEKLQIINVAQHIEQKQIDKALLILDKLKDKIDFVFINVGDGHLLQKHRDIVKDRGLEKNVKFLGRLPYEDVIKLLYKSDLFLMTSRDVIFDLITLEAMYIGLPVLVSADGGNLELINHNKNGFLILPDKPQETAELIIKLKNDFELYKMISNNAKKTIKDNYTVKKMFSDYLKIYDELNLKFYGK